LVDKHPLRKRLRELLMLAVYRSGRQADALHSYQRVRALLTRDVDIEPGPGLRTLHQQILQSAPELSADIGC
jgi:DNA-binding SARP family transcriptional activator